MFNDDYEDETVSTEDNNDSSKNFKIILIIAGIFIAFIVILLIVNAVSKPKTQPQPAPSAPVVIDDDDYESGEDEGEKEEVPEEQRVGSSSYGYITIPGDWVAYQDANSNSSLQYTDGTYIITLKAVQSSQSSALSYATAVKRNFENDGVDTTGATVSLGKYKAYQVYGYYTSVQKWHVCWIFEAEDGKTHFISVEGPEKTEAFKIPETFSIIR